MARHTLTDFEKIGAYKGVDIQARTYWGKVKFSIWNYKNKNEYGRKIGYCVIDSFNIHEIIKHIDNRVKHFYHTEDFENNNYSVSTYNTDLDYYRKFLEQLKNKES
jgi:hypothetical protein